jgi:hypothetical protein
MKLFKASWKVCLAGMIGLVLGAWAFRVPTVKAQSRRALPQALSGSVWVERVPYLENDGRLQPKGDQVVGFSCVQTDRETECYVASR